MGETYCRPERAMGRSISVTIEINSRRGGSRLAFGSPGSITGYPVVNLKELAELCVSFVSLYRGTRPHKANRPGDGGAPGRVRS